ncbi:MAG TPA: ElyC/SanA/YdcF family protein [Promineifilum sp.]|nr:ElyC/SanA/YdcF family protein [Promineifilum sp.]
MFVQRKGCLGLFIAIALLVAVPLVWRSAIKAHYRPATYTRTDSPARSVAVVFGAAVYNGRLSPVLRDRVDTAVALYLNGQVERIIMSGGQVSAQRDEPATMKAYAVAQGVDAAAIITDHGGQRTYDTCYRARYVYDVRDAILVTQAFHLPRALLTCDGLGVNTIGVVADQQPYRSAHWYEMRETIATVVAAWDIFRRQPPALIETAGQRSDWAMQLAGDD